MQESELERFSDCLCCACFSCTWTFLSLCKLYQETCLSETPKGILCTIPSFLMGLSQGILLPFLILVSKIQMSAWTNGEEDVLATSRWEWWFYYWLVYSRDIKLEWPKSGMWSLLMHPDTCGSTTDAAQVFFPLYPPLYSPQVALMCNISNNHCGTVAEAFLKS